MFSDVQYRMRALFRRDAVEQELNEELQMHLEYEAAKYERAGMSSSEAMRKARLALGASESVREECRDARGVSWLETAARDVRYGWRVLVAKPAFLSIAVLSLAIGIGANTAVFSVVNGILLRTLPVKNPQDLVVAYTASDSQGQGIWRRNSSSAVDPETGVRMNDTFSPAVLDAFRREASAAVEVFGFYSPGRVGLADANAIRAAHMTLVTDNYFDAGGVTVALGRALNAEDDRLKAPVAVLSHSFWERALQADPSVVGKVMRLNGTPVTIVGITARGFHGMASAGMDGPADMFAPLSTLDHFFPREFRTGKPKTAPEHWWMRVMGRRKPGVTLETAQAQMTASFQRALAQSGVPVLESLKNPRVILHSGDRGLEGLRNAVLKPLLVLLGVAAVVLLLACLNVAILQLARSSARAREIALRVALGATRSRIAGQLLVESILLAVMGAAAGGLVALWGAPFIAKMLTATQSRVALDLTPDIRVLLFTTAAVVITGVLFGVMPALRAVRTDVTPNLRPAGASPSGGDSFTTGRMLMSLQVALSIVLLAGSGLLLRSLWNLNRMDLGFQRDRLLVFRLDPGQSGATMEQAATLHDRVLEEIRKTPGVTSATAMSMPLITGWHNGAGISRQQGNEVSALMNTVSPEYFQTMGIPLLAGRTFRRDDGESRHPVAILNQSAARKLFGGDSPVGQMIYKQGGGTRREMEVIGVVRDAKYAAMRNEIQPTLYTAWAHDELPFTFRSYSVRTAGDPLAMTTGLRQSIAGVNRDLVMMDVKTQTQLIDENLHQERLFASLLTMFGGFALTLSAIGLYGVTAYLTGRRTAEIGIRVALGSSSSRVLRLFAGQMLMPVLIGTAAGLGAAWAGVRLIESMLFGVDRVDTITLSAVVFLLFAVAALAVLWPAWRASRVDPMMALRAD